MENENEDEFKSNNHVCKTRFSPCTYCGGNEGSWTTDCPKVMMNERIKNDVRLGKKDYINGKWIGVNDD